MRPSDFKRMTLRKDVLSTMRLTDTFQMAIRQLTDTCNTTKTVQLHYNITDQLSD